MTEKETLHKIFRKKTELEVKNKIYTGIQLGKIQWLQNKSHLFWKKDVAIVIHLLTKSVCYCVKKFGIHYNKLF